MGEYIPRNKRHIEHIYNPRNKVDSVNLFIDSMLNRTLTMFKYNNLPDSLPERELELILQVGGNGIVTEYDNSLVAYFGSYAPPLDLYYRPTKFLVNNPWNNVYKEFEINKDCILVRNDPLDSGLMPIFNKYATFLTETDLTLYITDINFRSIYNIVASSDSEFESAKKYLNDIEEGKLGVILEEDMSNGVKTQPYSASSNGYITQCIELEQYLWGRFLNEIGLNANYNMKRERLSASETDLNEDGLRPLIDSMLEERQLACERINKMFGTNISVEFGSAWGQYNGKRTDNFESVNNDIIADSIDEDGNDISSEEDNGEDSSVEGEVSTDIIGNENIDSELETVNSETSIEDNQEVEDVQIDININIESTPDDILEDSEVEEELNEEPEIEDTEEEEKEEDEDNDKESNE